MIAIDRLATVLQGPPSRGPMGMSRSASTIRLPFWQLLKARAGSESVVGLPWFRIAAGAAPGVNTNGMPPGSPGIVAQRVARDNAT